MFAGRFDERQRVTLSAEPVQVRWAVADRIATRQPQAEAVQVAASSTKRVPAADEVDLCGVGIVKRADLEQPDSAARLLPDQGQRRQRWLATLQSSPDELVRANGHYFAAALAWWEPRNAPLRERLQACAEKGNCAAADLKGGLLDTAPALPEIEALAEAATTSANADVYGLAVQACIAANALPRAGSCQLVSLERWAQLDADNLVPWLYLAAARTDAPGRKEALYRASMASTNRRPGESFMSTIEPSLPADSSELDRSLLGFEALSIATAVPLPPYQTVTRYCSADAVRDANVRQVCDRLASALVEKGHNLMELAIGIGVGERSGWSAERVAALRRERAAYFEVAPVVDFTQMDCASLKAGNEALSRRARLGELAYMRQLVVESRESIEALAKRQEGKRQAAEARMDLVGSAAASTSTGAGSAPR